MLSALALILAVNTPINQFHNQPGVLVTAVHAKSILEKKWFEAAYYVTATKVTATKRFSNCSKHIYLDILDPVFRCAQCAGDNSYKGNIHGN